jgi:hypothetical protein
MEIHKKLTLKTGGIIMKIETKKFTSFLKKFKMTGAQSINEAVFKFENDGLKVTGAGGAKQSRIQGWLKKTAFKEYEVLGNVGMNDLENVSKVLERFGELVTIKKEGNLFTITGNNKTVDIELVSENFLDGDVPEPTLEFEDTFSIPSSKIKEVFKDTQMNKDSILSIQTEDKKVIFSNTGKYKFKTMVEALTCKGGVKVDFGEPIIEALSNLDGDLSVSVKSNYPIRVIEKTEDSIFNVIIAPRVDD